MTIITFYEKPGCANNSRQKLLLAAAGHTVQAKSLLTEPWTRERLLAFFGIHNANTRSFCVNCFISPRDLHMCLVHETLFVISPLENVMSSDSITTLTTLMNKSSDPDFYRGEIESAINCIYSQSYGVFCVQENFHRQ